MLSDNYSGPVTTGVSADSGRLIVDVGQGSKKNKRHVLKKMIKNKGKRKGTAKQMSDANTIEKRENLITKVKSTIKNKK